MDINIFLMTILMILNFILLSKSGSTKFPTDDDFENALINKEVYKTKNKFYSRMIQIISLIEIHINLQPLHIFNSHTNAQNISSFKS